MEATYLAKVTGKPEFEEAFDSAVIFFTDDTYDEVKKQASAMPVDPHAAAGSENHPRDKTRIEGEVLGRNFNPKRGQSFRAYLHGKKYNDLRFLMIPSRRDARICKRPEEAALLNVDADENGGIWYLSHSKSEWARHGELQ